MTQGIYRYYLGAWLSWALKRPYPSHRDGVEIYKGQLEILAQSTIFTALSPSSFSPPSKNCISLVVMAGHITVTLIGWSSCDVWCCMESLSLLSNWGCSDCRADYMKNYFLGHYLILLFSALFLSPLLSDFCPLQMTLRLFKTRMSKRNSASRAQRDRRGPEIALLLLGVAVHWSTYRSLRIVFPASGAGSRYTLIFIKKCCCILWDL